MDYSLLVGIHNIDQAAGRKIGGGGGGAGGLASILTGGGEESAISWDPEEGSDDRQYGQQRRPAMLERIGKQITVGLLFSVFHLFR